ncbi:unnamed protein product [Closterium sp. NIES-64]|nr:unnamed protein product [Closterium sp. NIES-64]
MGALLTKENPLLSPYPFPPQPPIPHPSRIRTCFSFATDPDPMVALHGPHPCGVSSSALPASLHPSPIFLPVSLHPLLLQQFFLAHESPAPLRISIFNYCSTASLPLHAGCTVDISLLKDEQREKEECDKKYYVGKLWFTWSVVGAAGRG